MRYVYFGRCSHPVSPQHKLKFQIIGGNRRRNNEAVPYVRLETMEGQYIGALDGAGLKQFSRALAKEIEKYGVGS